MNPKTIKVENKKLKVVWTDETSSEIGLEYLRRECPCANCKGETILFKTMRPVKKDLSSPDVFKIQKIEIIGGYAAKIIWKDGHNTGLYTWEYLKTLADDKASGKSHEYKPLI